MTSRTAALRYARALFDVVVSEHRVEQPGSPGVTDRLQEIEQQLAQFGDLLKANPALEHVLLNPAVPAPRKRGAVAEIVGRAGVAVPLAKLLTLLAERDRLVILPEVIGAYHQRVLDHLNVVRAEVTTAMALAAGRAEQIERDLATATGRKVLLSTRVDPALIGGAVTRIGSTVYDGSIVRQLEKMRERLEQS